MKIPPVVVPALPLTCECGARMFGASRDMAEYTRGKTLHCPACNKQYPQYTYLPHRPDKTHLGGGERRTHIDEGALRFLSDYIDHPDTLLDIGCGIGRMRQVCEKLNMTWLGIEGDDRLEPPIVHDFTEGPWTGGVFDIGWCVEFLEHIEEKYLPNVFETLRCCDWVAATAAPPGCGGWHHVNEQPTDYWVDRFEQEGFSYQVAATITMRRRSTMKKDFMRKTGMLFRRRRR